MILKKLIINNFRCYKDPQELEFNDDGKITLIVGNSGAGKSTLIQFINWMFYDIFPSNKSSQKKNKPLYNEVLFDEKDYGDIIKVEGSVLFSHDNTEYALFKEYIYKKEFYDAKLQEKNIHLNYKYKNGNWIQYNGNIIEKLDEIVPKSLSKYFFFSGEENVITESNKDLINAIYKLFGVSKYIKALEHIGDKGSSGSLLYNYHRARTNLKPSGVTESASSYLTKYTGAKNAYDTYKQLNQKQNTKLKIIEYRIEELTKNIALSSKPEDNKKIIETNERLIKSNKNQIDIAIKSIGDIMYQSVPYLILSEKAKFTRDILAKYASEEKTFEGLKKDTLHDILKQGTCLCERCLDEKAISAINKLIKSMPPTSYNYTYNQFVKNLEKKTCTASIKYESIIKSLFDATTLKIENDELEQENYKLLRKMQESNNESDKKLATALSEAKVARQKLNSEIAESYKNYSNAEVTMKKYDKLYSEALKFETAKIDFNDKIEILEKVKEIINKKKNVRIDRIKEILNKSIIEVYETLSTRVENFEGKNFIDDNFALRIGYSTGGQETIDIYSYIIGMIKAMKIDEEDDKNENFPVVIDAPFSKLDDIQLNHILDVFPTIAGQVIMVSIYTKRFDGIDLSNIGNVWNITSNNAQTVANIKKGVL